MHIAIVLLSAAIAAPLPTRVQRAEGWPAVDAAVPPPSATFPPHLVPVKVGRRNRRVIREWRDRRQTYAIFWDAKSDGYRAVRIRGKRYVPIPGDKTSSGRPRLWPSFEDAANQVDAHWRFLMGKPSRTYAPSPKLKRLTAGKK